MKKTDETLNATSENRSLKCFLKGLIKTVSKQKPSANTELNILCSYITCQKFLSYDQ